MNASARTCARAVDLSCKNCARVLVFRSLRPGRLLESLELARKGFAEMTLIAETAFEGNITECCARFSQQPRPSQHAGSTHKCSGGHTKELTKCAREVYGVNTDRFGYVRERQIKSAFLTT